MRFLRGIVGVSRLDMVRNTAIREELGVQPLLLKLEKSLLRWFGHIVRMPQDRIAHQILFVQPTGMRPLGRPRMRWLDQIESMAFYRLGVPSEELSDLALDRSHWKELTRMLPSQPE